MTSLNRAPFAGLTQKALRNCKEKREIALTCHLNSQKGKLFEMKKSLKAIWLRAIIHERFEKFSHLLTHLTTLVEHERTSDC